MTYRQWDTPADAFPYWQGGPDSVTGNYVSQQTDWDIVWFLHGYGVSDGSYSEFIRRTTQYSGGAFEVNQGAEYLPPRDYEVRFTDAGSPGLFNFTSETFVHVPASSK